MTNQRAIILLSQMYLPNFDNEEKDALTKAIEALTEKEPRVLTALEVIPCLPYWLEFPDGELRPVICYDAEWDAKEPYIILVWQYGTSSYKTECYGLEWRCWSSRPTDEQRRETPWEG